MTADELRPLVEAALANARIGVIVHWSPYGQHEERGRMAALEAVLSAIDGDRSLLLVSAERWPDEYVEHVNRHKQMGQ